MTKPTTNTLIVWNEKKHTEKSSKWNPGKIKINHGWLKGWTEITNIREVEGEKKKINFWILCWWNGTIIWIDIV